MLDQDFQYLQAIKKTMLKYKLHEESDMKLLFVTFPILVVGAAVLTYSISDIISEPRNTRTIASAPESYESLMANEKQDILWKEIQDSAYNELPDFRSFGIIQLLALSKQELRTKSDLSSDFSPNSWKKYLHARGSVAKVKIAARKNIYTGIFQGADYGLLRLSLAYKPSGKRAVAPGLALKVLRDKVPSANISALVSLYGQEKDFNFFKFSMSNIVPMGYEIGQKLVHLIFESASKYPEELLANELANINVNGEKVNEVISPRQIFFVPNSQLKFSSAEHDIRNDFSKIPAGTVIYRIHAASNKYKDLDYSSYTQDLSHTLLLESDYIADVITTSEFISSDFGDEGLFFKHQIRHD